MHNSLNEKYSIWVTCRAALLAENEHENVHLFRLYMYFTDMTVP